MYYISYGREVHCRYIQPKLAYLLQRFAPRSVNMAPRVGYRGYGSTYQTINYMTYHNYGECATDEPFCVRRPNIFKKTPFFTRLICHITSLVIIRNFLWLHNHQTIITCKKLLICNTFLLAWN